METPFKSYGNRRRSRSAGTAINTTILLAIALGLLQYAKGAVVVPPGPCSNIQNAINSLPAGGGVVELSSGSYTCIGPIIIDRSNVWLRGEGPGTLIQLAPHRNTPLIIAGQAMNEPILTFSNIWISDLVLDGNRANQDFECWANDCARVRNNCISVRRAVNVVIERVTTRRARSGGVVVEKGSRRVTIRGLTSFENEFDGLAAYRTEDSVFSGLLLYNNCFAGLSLDLDFNNNTVSDANIFRTGASLNCPELITRFNVPPGTVGTVGVFLRDSVGNMFIGVRVRNPRQHGVFIADLPAGGGPAVRNTFSELVVRDIVDPSMNGFRVNNASCVGTILDAAQFINIPGPDIFEGAPIVKGPIVPPSQ
jgi:hypothetical protein